MKRTFDDVTGQRSVLPPAVACPAKRADITVLVGSNTGNDGTLYKRVAAIRGLDLDIVIPSPDNRAAYDAVSSLQRRDRLGRYVILDAHGRLDADGQHVVAFHEGALKTLDFLLHIRNEKLYAEKYRDTTIHLDTCGGATLREALHSVEGPHLICGGKKKVLSLVGRDTVVRVLSLLGRHKKAFAALPSPREVFDVASQFMGDTVSLVGKGIECHIRHAKTPADLANAASRKIFDAFSNRVCNDKAAQAEALLQVYPSLLSERRIGGTALELAYCHDAPAALEMLMRNGATWEVRQMIAVGAKFPQLVPGLGFSLGLYASQILAPGGAISPSVPAAVGAASSTGAVAQSDLQSDYQRALDCGLNLVLAMNSTACLSRIDALRALCGDNTLPQNGPAAIFQQLFNHLSRHLCVAAKRHRHGDAAFRESLARHCCARILRASPTMGGIDRLQQFLAGASLRAFLPVVVHSYKLAEAGSAKDAQAWLDSVCGLAVLQLLSASPLETREQVMDAMLYCLDQRNPMPAMASVWQRRREHWKSAHLEAEPAGDFEYLLSTIRHDCHHVLGRLLPDADRLLYSDFLKPPRKTVDEASEFLRNLKDRRSGLPAPVAPVATRTTGTSVTAPEVDHAPD